MCVPSPCGLFSQCSNQAGIAVCKCLPNYSGYPPNCKPECTSNSDCPNNLACMNERCSDPCPGSCGISAVCNVVNHNPNCACKPGFQGNAFARCEPIAIRKCPV